MGVTPLHWAAYGNASEIALGLLRAGAVADARCGRGYTPLMMATVRLYFDDDQESVLVAKELIAAGVDVNACRDHPDPSERHPVLYYALRCGLPSMCAILIDAGADVAAVAASPEALLPWLVADESAGEKIALLVNAGVDFTGSTYPGTNLPLLLGMAAQGSEEAVTALVGAGGGDATAVDGEGRTALQLLCDKRGERGDEAWKKGVKAGGGAARDFDSWDAIPREFEGLEQLLGPVYKQAPEKLGALFSKLTLEVQATVQEALRVMHPFIGSEGLEHIRFDILAQVFG